jgi:hypothetical protein
MTMKLSRYRLLGISLLLVVPPSLNGAEKEAKAAETILVAGRYLGLRPATEVTVESDYTFTLRADGTWSYRALIDGRQMRGDLGEDLPAWKKRLAKTGLADLKEAKGPLLAVEDAPQVTLEWTDGGKTRKFRLAPTDRVATAVDALIQELRKSATK